MHVNTLVRLRYLAAAAHKVWLALDLVECSI